MKRVVSAASGLVLLGLVAGGAIAGEKVQMNLVDDPLNAAVDILPKSKLKFDDLGKILVLLKGVNAGGTPVPNGDGSLAALPPALDGGEYVIAMHVVFAGAIPADFLVFVETKNGNGKSKVNAAAALLPGTVEMLGIEVFDALSVPGAALCVAGTGGVFPPAVITGPGTFSVLVGPLDPCTAPTNANARIGFGGILIP
jgi:hypothetical protein